MRHLIFLVLLSACNIVKLTADSTSSVLEVASPSLNMESDVQLAREAIPGQLKTVEGFLLASPENPKLLTLVARGYCEYGFGFLEGDMEVLELLGKTDDLAALTERTTRLYLRCMNYGLKLLGPRWDTALQGELDAFEAQVKSAKPKDVPGLFYTALGLASAININRDNVDFLAYLAKAKLMFERVVALDETYANAMAHIALGKLHSAQGVAVGGQPEEGRKHYERAFELSGSRFLMARVLLARTYGVITGNRDFFHKTLSEVLATSPAIWPEQRLANELAHVRARLYLEHEREWF